MTNAMNTTAVAVIINMCSAEAPFLDAMLSQCALFARPDNTVVSYAAHLCNGEADDLSYVALDPGQRRGVVHRPTAYWHNLARFTAASALAHSDADWVFVPDLIDPPYQGGYAFDASAGIPLARQPPSLARHIH